MAMRRRRVIAIVAGVVMLAGATIGGVVVVRLRQARIPDPKGYFKPDPLAPPEIAQVKRPDRAISKETQAQHAAAIKIGVEQPDQILFGDTHVHTTYSADAFLGALPFMNGSRGANPPADVCDYARYVSQLDFFFLTDHAESYTPQRWHASMEAIRMCNAVAGDPRNPDVVAFMGFEWSQVGRTAKDHYGHENVLFRDPEPGKFPSRPIAAAGLASNALHGALTRVPPNVLKADPGNASFYEAFDKWGEELRAAPKCAEGVNERQLPPDCYDTAATPGDLYRKLNEWGFDTIVIPHGGAWGIYTPPNSTWDLQLNKQNHDPDKARLIEVYSGHGNSEPWRDFYERTFDKDGKAVCPVPQANYLPSCWQAGEIIRKRCKAAGSDDRECDRRALQARQIFADQDTLLGPMTIGGSDIGEWLDSGQARDIYKPAFNYRPSKSVQYGLALRNFDDPKNPLRYIWGFVASTDTHSARPGHGFKQYMRVNTSDAALLRAASNDWWYNQMHAQVPPPAAQASPLPAGAAIETVGLRMTETERGASFMYVGGLAAVHSTGRTREEIWDALKRKEVYATTGHRILLWFDLLNAGGKPAPMGSQLAMAQAPTFRVRAIGSFKQLPGCPDWVKQALSERRLVKLADGECYNPSDERYNIDRLEIVRIRPQNYKDEPLKGLIEDNWKVIQCKPDPAGCTAEFSDPDFASRKRDALYYVRAIEEPTPQINAGTLRATFDKDGNPVSVSPCYGDYRTPKQDNCLAEASERAWSSPIYVDYAK